MIGKFKTVALIGAAVAFVGHWVLHFAVAGALFAAIGLSSISDHDHSDAVPDNCICEDASHVHSDEPMNEEADSVERKEGRP